MKTRPALIRPRLYLAYQVDKAGHGMKLVTKTVRDVVAASSVLEHR